MSGNCVGVRCAVVLGNHRGYCWWHRGGRAERVAIERERTGSGTHRHRLRCDHIPSLVSGLPRGSRSWRSVSSRLRQTEGRGDRRLRSLCGHQGHAYRDRPDPHFQAGAPPPGVRCGFHRRRELQSDGWPYHSFRNQLCSGIHPAGCSLHRHRLPGHTTFVGYATHQGERIPEAPARFSHGRVFRRRRQRVVPFRPAGIVPERIIQGFHSICRQFLPVRFVLYVSRLLPYR